MKSRPWLELALCACVCGCAQAHDRGRDGVAGDDEPGSSKQDRGDAAASLNDEDEDEDEDGDRDAAVAQPKPWDDWLVYGGDLDQQNARVDADAFSRDAMGVLQHAWSVPAPGVTGTPVVRDGVVYFADWMGGVYAVAPDTGRSVWSKAFARGFTASPAIDDERLYLGDRDGLVYALDPDDGSVIWERRLDDDPLAQVWSSPAVAEGVVVVGIGGKSTSYTDAELMAFRGSISGLAADTGDVLWRFETTIGPTGERFGAGVAVWSSAAIDLERSVLYIGTGNSYFSPASPYSDSLLALELHTGAVVWSRQFTSDDNFTRGNPVGPDSDVGATPNLFRIGARDVIGVGDKAGNYYVMDRGNGELLWSQMLSPGSSLGGVIGNAAVADGRVYVGSNENFLFTQLYALDARNGDVVWNITLNGPSYGSVLRLGDALFASTSTSQLFALDPNTGDTLWAGSLEQGRAGGLSASREYLFVPTGFHVFMDELDPVPGSLMAFRVGGQDDGSSEDVMIPLPAEPTYEPTFEAIYTEIFRPMGCTASFCHGREGNLSLQSRELAHAQLVDVEASGELCADTGMLRVKPRAPGESLLVSKLGQDPPCGVRMPVGGMLNARQLAQIVEWIEAGANDD